MYFLVTKKKLNELVNKRITEMANNHHNGVFKEVVYYNTLLEENENLKKKIERQNVILTAFRIVREFINE